MTQERSAMERLVVDAGLVEPPEDLRDRVIRSAVAVVHHTARASWADRVWYSTRWRVATAMILLGLVLLNAVPAPTDTRPADRFGRTAYEAAESAQQAARRRGVPEADCLRLGAEVLVGVSRPVQDGAFISKEKE